MFDRRLAWVSWALLWTSTKMISRAFAAATPLASESPPDNCTFSRGNLEFNLCPVFQSHDEFKLETGRDTPPTYTTEVYTMTFGGSKRDPTLPSELQCPDGTWICLTMHNSRPSHPSEPERILQVVPVAVSPGLRPVAWLGDKKDKHANNVAPLQVMLHGGAYTNIPQKAVFSFICDHQSTEPSKPDHTWTWNGTHSFTWNTRHACAKALAGSPKPAEPDPDPIDLPPQDKEQIPIPTASRSFFSLVALWISPICIVLVAITYPYRHHRRFTSCMSAIRIYAYSKRLSFRPSASRLVRWAQEAGIEEEDDFMVNSSPRAYEHVDGDEGVPLTPLPGGTFGSKMGGAYGSVG